MLSIFELATAAVRVSDRTVICEFPDGTHSECDIDQSHNDKYRETARFWGYDDHVRYAQHHDLAHCWLWDRLYGEPSPTLWAEARGLSAPPENRLEEHLVNHAQYTLAQGSVEFASFLSMHMGPYWRDVLEDFRLLVAANGLPFPLTQTLI